MDGVDGWLGSAREVLSAGAEQPSPIEARIALEPVPAALAGRRLARRSLTCAAGASLVAFVVSGMAVPALTRGAAPTWIGAASAASPYNVLIADAG